MESEIKKDDIKGEIENNSIRVKEFDTKKGGIYLEITDDPRGWMLGDKTRRIYKATIAQVALLTNLLVKISPHWNGIKVKVHNPNEVSRMLVSLNDDVGSSVEYAKHDGSKPLELSARMGQHICIESMTNGNWIRVQIFPGEDAKKYYDSIEDAKKYYDSIEKGDKFVHISNDSKFSNNVMTVTEVKKDPSYREREDIIYFSTEYPVDSFTDHDARAWWFLDNCIKIR